MTEREVVIRQVEPMALLSVEHAGAYWQINRAFETLTHWLEQHRLLAAELRLIGIYYDDPSVVEERALRSKACVLLPHPVQMSVTVSPPVAVTHVDGGEYAVLLHQGPYSDLPATYEWLYRTWLPASGRQGAQAPSFEEYLNSPMDTAPADLKTEIFLPLV